MIVAGIGCRRDCPADDIFGLIQTAGARVGHTVSLLAAPSLKRDEPGLLAAARMLGLKLVLVDPAALAAVQHRCPSRSNAAERATGIASVAEGCALAAAGENSRLLLPRIAGPRATCALAETAA
jgi:cobalt-precorrin 5A hydrolase